MAEQSAQSLVEMAQEAADAARVAADQAQAHADRAALLLQGLTPGAEGGGSSDSLLLHLSALVLAIIVGGLVWRPVRSGLHARLLAGTLVLAGIVIVGAIGAVGAGAVKSPLVLVLGLAGLALAGLGLAAALAHGVRVENEDGDGGEIM